MDTDENMENSRESLWGEAFSLREQLESVLLRWEQMQPRPRRMPRRGSEMWTQTEEWATYATHLLATVIPAGGPTYHLVSEMNTTLQQLRGHIQHLTHNLSRGMGNEGYESP